MVKWGSEVIALISQSQDFKEVKRIQSFQRHLLLLRSLWESFRDLLPVPTFPKLGNKIWQLHPDTSSPLVKNLHIFQPPKQPPGVLSPPPPQLASGAQRAKGVPSCGPWPWKLQSGWHWPALCWSRSRSWDWLCTLGGREAKVRGPGLLASPQDFQLGVSQNLLPQNDQGCSVKMQVPAGPEVWAWESVFLVTYSGGIRVLSSLGPTVFVCMEGEARSWKSLREKTSMTWWLHWCEGEGVGISLMSPTWANEALVRPPSKLGSRGGQGPWLGEKNDSWVWDGLCLCGIWVKTPIRNLDVCIYSWKRPQGKRH